HLAPDGPDQTETADEGSEQLQPSYGCEGLAGCGKCKTEIICHHMGELLRNIFAKDYKPLHYLKPQVLRIGVKKSSLFHTLSIGNCTYLLSCCKEDTKPIHPPHVENNLAYYNIGFLRNNFSRYDDCLHDCNLN